MAHRRPRLARQRRQGVRRAIALVAVCCALLVAALATAAFLFSGVSLVADGSALARVHLQPFAGSLVRVRAADPDGTPIPLATHDGVLTPTTRLPPGEHVHVSVVVRRPGWSSWALGSERDEHLTISTPVAHVSDRWLTVAKGRRPVVRFAEPVSAVSVGGAAAVPARSSTVAVDAKAPAGTTTVAAAVRTWERLGPPVRVTWFPRTSGPALLASPAAGRQVDPLTPLRLTFSEPLDSVFPAARPTLASAGSGRWVTVDSHTLVYRPSGYGAPLDSVETVRLPVAVSLAGAAAPTKAVSWRIAPASFLRLEQLLAQEGYLPVVWSPGDADVPRTARSELAAATAPPPGRFRWRYPDTPHELQALWRTGEPNEIVRGAVMMFEHDHGLDVDGIAGAQVWHAAIADALAGRTKAGGYSYVYVHRNVPQLLTLWHDGHVVLTSPGNTGVPAAPTQLGTWPVFEHIPVGRMSGTNPDGSHYDDPGIRWISYFHGGEALHAFTRASFGTPQSLGCVELPLASAEQVWPYTPIGTLVTIEN